MVAGLSLIQVSSPLGIGRTRDVGATSATLKRSSCLTQGARARSCRRSEAMKRRAVATSLASRTGEL